MSDKWKFEEVTKGLFGIEDQRGKILATSSVKDCAFLMSKSPELLQILKNMIFAHKACLRGAALNITPLEDAENIISEIEKIYA